MTAIVTATRRFDFRAYFDLFKPRVMSLVVFTGFVGLWLAPGAISIWTLIIVVACIALGAGGAGAINMWYDADIDQLMERTRSRPVPSGKVQAHTALYLGLIATLVATLVLAWATNVVATGLLIAANLYYVLVYTLWLKRRTAQNIVIGGAAGAFPPMIGWAAVTGDLAPLPIVLFLIIFLWTPPHFWSLALYRMGDYEKAGIPMLPNVAGRKVTRRHILVYAALLLPLTLVPYFLSPVLGWVYLIGAGILTLLFLVLSAQLYQKDHDTTARNLFAYSIGYLFLLFSLMLVNGRGVTFV